MFQAAHDCTTLVKLLRFRAARSPLLRAYTFLKDGLHEDHAYTYAELDRAARAIAVALGVQVRPGGRVLLVYPPGWNSLPPNKKTKGHPFCFRKPNRCFFLFDCSSLRVSAVTACIYWWRLTKPNNPMLKRDCANKPSRPP